jgi:hypothetical protein
MDYTTFSWRPLLAHLKGMALAGVLWVAGAWGGGGLDWGVCVCRHRKFVLRGREEGVSGVWTIGKPCYLSNYSTAHSAEG